MKSHKFEYTIIGILIVFSLIIIGIYLIINTYKEKNSYILLTKPYDILKCYKYDCVSLKENINENNNDIYETYMNGEYKGQNKISYNQNNKQFYLYSLTDHPTYIDENTYDVKTYLLGVKGKIKVKEAVFNSLTMDYNDFNVISELTKMNIEYIDYVPIYKYVADYNNDGFEETIYNYTFSNNNKYYNLIAYCTAKKCKKVFFNSYTSDNVITYQIEDIIDIYEDGKLELLVSKNSLNSYCHEIYRLKGNKFVTSGCELNKK